MKTGMHSMVAWTTSKNSEYFSVVWHYVSHEFMTHES